MQHPLIVILAGAGGLLVASSLALWLHYGTAVFYEMILAGVPLCLCLQRPSTGTRHGTAPRSPPSDVGRFPQRPGSVWRDHPPRNGPALLERSAGRRDWWAVPADQSGWANGHRSGLPGPAIPRLLWVHPLS